MSRGKRNPLANKAPVRISLDARARQQSTAKKYLNRSYNFSYAGDYFAARAELLKVLQVLEQQASAKELNLRNLKAEQKNIIAKTDEREVELKEAERNKRMHPYASRGHRKRNHRNASARLSRAEGAIRYAVERLQALENEIPNAQKELDKALAEVSDVKFALLGFKTLKG